MCRRVGSIVVAGRSPDVGVPEAHMATHLAPLNGLWTSFTLVGGRTVMVCSVRASAATPFLLCVLIRLQLMFLLGNHNTLDAPPLYLASKVVRD